MLRKATQDDLPALVALRCKAARTNRTDAAGWLQNVAGLENLAAGKIRRTARGYAGGCARWSTASITASGSAAWQGSRTSRSTVAAKRWKAACGLMGPAALTLLS